MRAVEPTSTGYATNPDDGVRIFYEVFGPEDAGRTVVFVPAWNLAHSAIWRMQVPYFAQQGFRVIKYDPRGNGGSDRPSSGYRTEDFTKDLAAVVDEIEIEKFDLIGLSAGGRWAIQFASEQPDRVRHLIVIGPGVLLSGSPRWDLTEFFAEHEDESEGWRRFNANYWQRDFDGFLDWFIPLPFSEPHSTHAIELGKSWAKETTVDKLIACVCDGATPRMAEYAAGVRCPTLFIHGEFDALVPLERSFELQKVIKQAKVIVIEGGGHAPNGKDAVKVNLLIHDFIGRELPARSTWTRGYARTTKRALWVSSPVGLGHIQRDLEVARELRKIIPDLEIDWLAQHPVTAVLEASGERIHPASESMSGESAHIESWVSGDHELDVFESVRDMDEILLANFHIFLDAAREGCYDLWVCDEAWDVDHFLHENPELKSAPFAWLTDVIGFLPAYDDERQAFLTADHNLEMIEHIERYPWVQDVRIFIGNAEDIVPGTFGEGLPVIRDWAARHYDFNGYIRYVDPDALEPQPALRERYGFGPDEQVVVAAVGGSGVGAGLLQRILAGYPAMRERIPDLRLVVVAGPRIDPAELPQVEGVDCLGYVHNLYEMFAAADAALVQGGLSTTMELVGLQKPFLYFPITNHFEQNIHVAHRLGNYGVPDLARVPFDRATPDETASRLAQLLDNPPTYRQVESSGARKAAEKIAVLIQDSDSLSIPAVPKPVSVAAGG